MNMFREVMSKDKPMLINLYKQFILDMSRYDSDDNNPEAEILSWIDTALTGKKSTIFVSENDKGINGFTRIQHKERLSDGVENEPVHYVKLSDLYVLPEARRNGIASQLINLSINWAKEHKTNELILNVYERNESAKKLYKTFGFKDDGIISHGRIRMKCTV